MNLVELTDYQAGVPPSIVTGVDVGFVQLRSCLVESSYGDRVTRVMVANKNRMGLDF